MLRISNSELKLTSHGYHFDDRGRKYVRIFTSLNFIKIQVKLQPHKDLHVIWMSGISFTNSWLEITFPYQNVEKCSVSWMAVENYIDGVLNNIWFV